MASRVKKLMLAAVSKAGGRGGRGAGSVGRHGPRGDRGTGGKRCSSSFPDRGGHPDPPLISGTTPATVEDSSLILGQGLIKNPGRLPIPSPFTQD